MRALQSKRETGCYQSRQRSGRPRATLNPEDQFICVQSKRNCTRTAPEICKELNPMRETPVSVSTIKRCLRNYGLNRCVATKKQLLC